MPTRYGLARYRASYLIWWSARADSGEPRPRKRTPKQARKKLFRLAGKETVINALPAGGFGRQLLETTNSAFTQVWILHTLDRLRAPLPEIYNRDGEQFVSTEAQFPVDKDRRQEIIQRLDAAAPRRRAGTPLGLAGRKPSLAQPAVGYK